MPDINDWIKDISGGASLRAIAEQSDIPFSTLARRVKINEITADEIIAISIAYGKNPIAQLIELDKIPAQYNPFETPQSFSATMNKLAADLNGIMDLAYLAEEQHGREVTELIDRRRASRTRIEPPLSDEERRAIDESV